MYKTLSPFYIGFSEKFKDVAQSVADAGFDGYWFDIVEDSKYPSDKTIGLLNKTGLRSAGFSLPTDFRNEEEVFTNELIKLKDYAQYAESIGAKRCVTWIAPFSDKYPWVENFDIHCVRLRKISEILSSHGISFGIEFLAPPKLREGKKYEFIHNLDQILTLCNAVGTGNCGLLMDVWHWDLAGQTKADFGKITADMVVLAHIQDAPAGIAVSEQISSVRKLPGATGVLKIADFFDGLLSIGYDGPVLAEPFDKELTEKPFNEAIRTVMDSINSVWPL